MYESLQVFELQNCPVLKCIKIIITNLWGLQVVYSWAHRSNCLCNNFSNSKVLELKNKINPDTINHITYTGTRNEEEIWVGRTSRLYFVG